VNIKYEKIKDSLVWKLLKKDSGNVKTKIISYEYNIFYSLVFPLEISWGWMNFYLDCFVKQSFNAIKYLIAALFTFFWLVSTFFIISFLGTYWIFIGGLESH